MKVSGRTMNFWNIDDGVLKFSGDHVLFAAERSCGWKSWKVRDAEFLAAASETGALFFRRGGEVIFPNWADMSNLTGDAMTGRRGEVGDGIFSARITTGWTLPQFELYVGFNLTEDHELVILLNRDVQMIRCGAPEAPRPAQHEIFLRDDERGPREAPDGCVAVHRSGVALAVHSPCRVETLPGDSGEKRLALIFACRGHAPNSFEFTAEAHVNSGNFVGAPDLRVEASNKKQSDTLWAIYEPGTDLTFSFSFDWYGSGAFQGCVNLCFKHALGGEDFAERRTVTEDDREGDGYTLHIKPDLHKPGVSDVWARLLEEDGTVIHAERFRAMYNWRNYRPNFFSPSDLKEFWDTTLQELRAIPLEAETTRVFEDFPDWELFTVSYRSWHGKRVYALMRVPKGVERPLPVVLASHPGGRGWGINRGPDGVYGSKINADPRFVTLSPLVRGFEPDDPAIPFNHPWWGGLENRDNYVAREWYCTMVRGLDYIATRPELADMRRIVVRGGSQGGALALVTAALDHRVNWCLADSPSNCMLHEIIDPEKYGSFGPSAGQVPDGQSLEDVQLTLSYYDPANLAQFIQCPTVIGVNVGDMCVHSIGGLSAYHNLQQLDEDHKWFLPGVHGTAHRNSADAGEKMRQVLDRVVENSSRKPGEISTEPGEGEGT